MLGSGELGKEVVIEFQRYGVEVIAVDRYPNAPAMQVAHRSYSISMLDAVALRGVIEKERPDYIVPEVEAIATQTLVELEKEGFTRHSNCECSTADDEQRRYPDIGRRKTQSKDITLPICVIKR